MARSRPGCIVSDACETASHHSTRSSKNVQEFSTGQSPKVIDTASRLFCAGSSICHFAVRLCVQPSLLFSSIVHQLKIFSYWCSAKSCFQYATLRAFRFMSHEAEYYENISDFPKVGRSGQCNPPAHLASRKLASRPSIANGARAPPHLFTNAKCGWLGHARIHEVILRPWRDLLAPLEGHHNNGQSCTLSIMLTFVVDERSVLCLRPIVLHTLSSYFFAV